MTNSAQPQSSTTVTPYIVPEQMFALIDSILPFEVCLYHQVLPLSVRDNTLYLGSVHPDESEGLKYVQALLAHTPYTIALKPITATTQQHYLSAFLSYDRQIKEAGEDLIEKSAEMALADDSSYAEFLDDSEVSTIPDGPPCVGTAANQLDSTDDEVTPGLAETIAAPLEEGDPATAPEQETDPTLDVDLETIIPAGTADTDSSIKVPRKPTQEGDTEPGAVTGAIASSPDSSKVGDSGDSDSAMFAQEFEAALAAEDIPGSRYAPGPERAHIAPGQPNIGTSYSVSLPPSKPTPPPLVLDQVDDELSPETLRKLPPRALTQVLMQRSIVQGIGRLFLERHPNHGRILCSQDGVLEAVLDPIPLPSFQGVINELKLLAEVPLLQVERAKQIDLERLYQGELLLLRLRLTPGVHGEEATLQVLRGAALKFYQQQQLGKLGQNALTLARRLQHQVAEIEARSRLLPGVGTDSFPSVPELRQLVRYIATTLDHLSHSSPPV